MDRNSKEFKDLQEKWYKKLKRSGFEDIERPDEGLTIWASSAFKTNYNESVFKAKEEYYRAAGHFLHDHEFKNEFDRWIWRLHSEGLSAPEIVEIVKKKKRNMKVYKIKILKVISRLRTEMEGKCRPPKK